MTKRTKTCFVRSRLLAWLLAFNVVAFSSPMLPGWFALASEQSGTRLVALCTDKGLRLVAVPAEDSDDAPQSIDERAGFDCARCPLGKCSGSGFAPAPLAEVDSASAGVDGRAAGADHLPVTLRSILGPPSRAPPVVA